MVVPARDCAHSIGQLVREVLGQAHEHRQLDVTVVDNGSVDGTAAAARAAGARHLELPLCDGRGNPGAARNLGAANTTGDPLIFLDSDCLPHAGWLDALLDAFDRGEVVVGGSIDLPPGLPWSARMDYYCGAYHSHPRRPAGYVSNHTPANLGVRRSVFEQLGGFSEEGAAAYSNEERAWQGRLRQSNRRLLFEPRASVFHYNRPGLGNLLRRNYRWGYNSIEMKSTTGAARTAWIYRYPRTLVFFSVPLALLQSGLVLWCWLRAAVVEPLFFFPIVVASRIAHCTGTVVGTLRWLRRRGTGEPGSRPKWE